MAVAAPGADAPALRSAVEEFETLLRICSGLTAPRPVEELLDSLLTESRALVRAEAGTLYVIHNQRLRFVSCQNDARADACIRCAPLSERPWAAAQGQLLPLDPGSLAGHVAVTGRALRIPDVYAIPAESPFRFDPRSDQATGYRTTSMIALPLVEIAGSVLGVIQIINRLDDERRVIPFTDRDERILTSLASVAVVSLRNARLHEQLLQSHMDTIVRLATAAEFRNGETGDHIRRMSCYCEAVARQMGYPRETARTILVASPMHDVGKLGIPDAILTKPGPLTPEERRVMQGHTTMGSKILGGSENELLAMAARIALSHHERWDGRGYPAGTAGDDIPSEARIAAVADVFDALTSPRAYKPAFAFEQSMEMIRRERGRHFDPDVADAFCAVEGDVRAIYDAYQNP